MRIGREIRRRRKAQGWTLEELAEQSGLSPHYLSGLENEHRDPSLSTISKLAGAFSVAPGELLGGKLLSPATMEAARLFESAPSGVQEGVLQVLRAVASPRHRK